MSLKVLGAVVVILVCGGFGFSLAARHREEIHSLEMLLKILDYIECELNCRLTPLPQLCRQATIRLEHRIAEIFRKFADELDRQVLPDAYSCMYGAVSSVQNLPESVNQYLLELGETLGTFDLQGQVKELDAIRLKCMRRLEELDKDKDVRIRSYQTLGICAGAALTIILI